MNATHLPQYSIVAGLYGEFYVLADGIKVVNGGQSFPTMAAASEWIDAR